MVRQAQLWGVLATLLTAACGAAEAGGERFEVPIGTTLNVRLDQTLNANSSGPGDLVTGTLSQPVTDGNRVLIPAGAAVRGEIVEFQKDPPRMTVSFSEIKARGDVLILDAEVASVAAVRKSKMKGKGKKIGGGAAAGAVLGGVIGGNVKGAVVGGAAGAAAGTGVALATKDVQVYVPAGSTVRVRLDRPLEVRMPEEGGAQK